jgi:hypothetical protein
VHVIIFTVGLAQLGVEVVAELPRGVFAAGEHVRVEHATPVPCHEDEMDVERGTTYLPRRYSSGIVTGQWHALMLCR